MNPRIIMMNVEEVSNWLRIPRSTLYSLCRRGEIPSIKIGKHWRFERKRLENWLDKKIAGHFAEVPDLQR